VIGRNEGGTKRRARVKGSWREREDGEGSDPIYALTLERANTAVYFFLFIADLIDGWIRYLVDGRRPQHREVGRGWLRLWHG
jgi:hypothetical protein